MLHDFDQDWSSASRGGESSPFVGVDGVAVVGWDGEFRAECVKGRVFECLSVLAFGKGRRGEGETRTSYSHERAEHIRTKAGRLCD